MSKWMGTLDLAPRWAMFVGTGGVTQRHAHFAHKLVIAPDSFGDAERKRAQTADGRRPIAPDARVSVVGAEARGEGAWFVRSGVEHVVDASTDAIPTGVLDPEAANGSGRSPRTGGAAGSSRWILLFLDAGSVRDVPAELASAAIDALRRATDADRRAAIAADFVDSLPRIEDARVARAAALLRDEAGLDIPEVAARVRLSTTRLTHVFSERLGISPRSYRTWGTLRRALATMGDGRSLTEVAHLAGFADSAHLSRVFTKMLGVPPSSLGSVTIRARAR